MGPFVCLCVCVCVFFLILFCSSFFMNLYSGVWTNSFLHVRLGFSWENRLFFWVSFVFCLFLGCPEKNLSTYFSLFCVFLQFIFVFYFILFLSKIEENASLCSLLLFFFCDLSLFFLL